jgi:hypothetical protein
MGKKATKRQYRPRTQATARHSYRHGQRAGQWLVPLQADGYACFYHGHEDPNDHGWCGPQIFCCHKAATQFMAQHPDVLPANVTLQPMTPDALLAWLSPQGPRVFYFYFCDPINRQRVYFQGVSQPTLPDVLRFQTLLEEHIIGAQVVV